MSKKRRNHTPEFKAQVVLELLMWPLMMIGGEGINAEGGRYEQDKAGKMTINTESHLLLIMQGDGFFILGGMGAKSLAALLPMPFNR